LSYLDTPRFSFFGNFFANPSTINNATENYALDEQYNNNPPSAANPNSVWWNPQGQAFFEIPGPSGQIQPAPSCSVTGAMSADGGNAPNDPVVGAAITSVVWGGPPAQYGRLVDLDPDMQARSMVVGLRLQISINGQAALSGTVLPMNIIDIWGRITQGATGGLNAPACMYQSVMTDLAWGDLGGSSVLQALQTASASSGLLSFKMNVYNYNGTRNTMTFNYGNVAGSVGPYVDGEPYHFVAQRKMSLNSTLVPQGNAQLVNNAPFQVTGAALTIDLGNSVSMFGVQGAVTPNEIGAVNVIIDPAGANPITVPIYNGSSTYQQQLTTAAGIFTVALSAAAQTAIASAPAALQINPPTASPAAFTGTDAVRLKEGMAPASLGSPGTAAANAQIGVAELANGYYAAVDYNALRLENGQASWSSSNAGAEITGNAENPIICTQFGARVAVPIAITSVPNFYQFPDAEGQFPPINNQPMSAITMPASVTTSATTTNATITVTANALSPEERDPRRADIDGQIYTFSIDYTSEVGLPPMTFLVFEDSPVVTSPTWWSDVYPVFLQYAKLYPFMRGLIDLSDYNTVIAKKAAIIGMLSLPMDDPAFMPVTRDLSLLRRQMILDWYAAGAPVGTPPAGQGVQS
jgi:hypothetical protein